MLVNADFSRRVIVTPDQYQWVASPQDGVERMMLDRLGGEAARATSIVRYAPGAGFPRHPHPGGEEILVLSGTFCEGDAQYPAGWYLRNPPGSVHQPFSVEGTTIFVKLWQMQPGEQQHVRIDSRDPASWQQQGNRQVCPLFSDDVEQVCLQRLVPGETLFADAVNGAELLILAGQLVAWGLPCGLGSWIRLPAAETPEIVAGTQGATLYLKTGALNGMAAGA